MADGDVPGQLRRAVAGFGDSGRRRAPCWRSEWNCCAVEADDTGRFLAAMLQRMQAERRQCCGFGMAEDAEDAALFVKRIAVEITTKVVVAAVCETGNRSSAASPCLSDQ
jgi:hypothetical protein